jgi:hypothetical protein
MNQVMINAVELDMLMKEIQDLKADNFKLKKLLADERDRVDLLKSEVAWAENGYTREKPLDSSYPDGSGYWKDNKKDTP